MHTPKPLRKLIKKSESKERKSLKSVKHKMGESEHAHYKKGISTRGAGAFYKAQPKEKAGKSKPHNMKAHLDPHHSRRMPK